jgi:hypothetical protein
MALLSLIAFAANAVAHLVILASTASITLNDTWPIHLLSMVVFLAMIFSLCCGNFVIGQELKQLSPGEKGELYAFAQHIEKKHQGKSAWQRMFGRTPLWVGIATVLMFVYAFGSFAMAGFRNPVEVRERYGEPWLYDEFGGWIRRATEADLKQLQHDELHFATAGFALMAFVPWAYFTYRSPQTFLGSLSDEDETEEERITSEQ